MRLPKLPKGVNYLWWRTAKEIVDESLLCPNSLKPAPIKGEALRHTPTPDARRWKQGKLIPRSCLCPKCGRYPRVSAKGNFSRHYKAHSPAYDNKDSRMLEEV